MKKFLTDKDDPSEHGGAVKSYSSFTDHFRRMPRAVVMDPDESGFLILPLKIVCDMIVR